MLTPDDRKVRIAVNIMRARLTVVGFNLTIIALQLSRLNDFPGGIELPTLKHSVHLEPSVALLMGMGLSIFAMVSFITSSAFDRDGGHCDHWTLLAGDLFMYAALAHTVAGFFGPLMLVLNQITLDPAHQIGGLATLQTAIAILGGGAWLSAMYLGPVVSLLRSPFGRNATITLGVAYLLLVCSLAYVSAQAVKIELARNPNIGKPPPTVLNELIQPLRW